MTELKKVFDDFLIKRRRIQEHIEENTEDLVSIQNNINDMYAEVADLDKTIESIRRILDDGTKPTFNI